MKITLHVVIHHTSCTSQSHDMCRSNIFHAWIYHILRTSLSSLMDKINVPHALIYNTLCMSLSSTVNEYHSSFIHASYFLRESIILYVWIVYIHKFVIHLTLNLLYSMHKSTTLRTPIYNTSCINLSYLVSEYIIPNA